MLSLRRSVLINSSFSRGTTAFLFTSALLGVGALSAGTCSSNMGERHVDILIVGGGLSATTLAWKLETQRDPKPNFLLLEARSMLGGRLVNDDSNHDIDLGAAWIWPSSQPLMKKLVQKDMGLGTIEQTPESMYASTSRIQGGSVAIVKALAGRVPTEKIQLNSPVTKCELLSDSNEVRITYGKSSPTTIRANKVVFAIPPRMLEKHVTFDPPLSPEKLRAIANSNTWMAGVTKVALEYPEKFWEREEEEDFPFYALVGRFRGGEDEQPAFQVYDASTADVNALTAFTLASEPSLQNDDALAAVVARQFDQAWKHKHRVAFSSSGPAMDYTKFHVQRWPKEAYISENERPSQVQPHPHPMRALSQPEWDGRLLFGGTESDLSSPGVMEGAVGAALRCFDQLFR